MLCRVKDSSTVDLKFELLLSSGIFSEVWRHSGLVCPLRRLVVIILSKPPVEHHAPVTGMRTVCTDSSRVASWSLHGSCGLR